MTFLCIPSWAEQTGIPESSIRTRLSLRTTGKATYTDEDVVYGTKHYAIPAAGKAFDHRIVTAWVERVADDLEKVLQEETKRIVRTRLMPGLAALAHSVLQRGGATLDHFPTFSESIDLAHEGDWSAEIPPEVQAHRDAMAELEKTLAPDHRDTFVMCTKYTVREARIMLGGVDADVVLQPYKAVEEGLEKKLGMPAQVLR